MREEVERMERKEEEKIVERALAQILEGDAWHGVLRGGVRSGSFVI